MVRGLDVAGNIRASGAGRKMFLDIPFYRTGVYTNNPVKTEEWCARRDSNLRRFAGVSEAGARSRNPELGGILKAAEIRR
jgi:hypothetical protein